MLPNSLKITICGLIAVIFISGCSSTKPLLGEDSVESGHILKTIKIKADPYYEYRIRNIIENSLKSYLCDVSRYNINIEIKKSKSAVAYSQSAVLKEQKRIAAKIEIYDISYNKLFEKTLDSFSTYEVSDDFPYSGIASQRSTTRFMLEDLGNSISLSIVEFIKDRKYILN